MEEALEKQSRERQPRWTESIAVGREALVRETKEKLGIRAVGREVIEGNGTNELREPQTPYEAVFGLENVDLREDNTFIGTYLLQNQEVSLVRPEIRLPRYDLFSPRKFLPPHHGEFRIKQED